VGIRDIVSYEAQAAIEMEMIAEPEVSEAYSFRVNENNAGESIIDVKEMIGEIVINLKQGIPTGIISARFHNTVADFIVDICNQIRKKSGNNHVVLSGGVFQNRYLLKRVCDQLEASEFNPYFHKKIPTNDGGVSLGQAIIANARNS